MWQPVLQYNNLEISRVDGVKATIAGSRVIYTIKVQSNLFNTDTAGTEQSVRIREVSVLKRSPADTAGTKQSVRIREVSVLKRSLR